MCFVAASSARWCQGLPVSCHVELHSFYQQITRCCVDTTFCVSSHLLVGVWVITSWAVTVILLWTSMYHFFAQFRFPEFRSRVPWLQSSSHRSLPAAGGGPHWHGVTLWFPNRRIQLWRLQLKHVKTVLPTA